MPREGRRVHVVLRSFADGPGESCTHTLPGKSRLLCCWSYGPMKSRWRRRESHPKSDLAEVA